VVHDVQHGHPHTVACSSLGDAHPEMVASPSCLTGGSGMRAISLY
jgi:hypothetical protein